MYTLRFDSKEAQEVMRNIIDYSEGFIKETKAKESTVTKKLAQTSVEAFYDYLDGLARTNPGMLHHIYEWGQVGNPSQRLVELKIAMAGSDAQINADFLQSGSVPEGGTEPFYEKATIMEEGIPVTIQAIEAKAMFFEYQGEEFFRVGPIVIENPGGEAVRGSFVNAFEEFYNSYFEEVYLRAIRFYDHFSKAPGYKQNFGKAAKASTSAESIGRATALKWIMSMPSEGGY